MPIPTRISYLSVVLSFRNEAEVLPAFIKRIRSVLKQLIADKVITQYELIFVDDASSDQSRDILLEQDKGHQDIRIITMSRTFGVAPCVIAGFKHASGDALVYMDCDLQDPPELITDMVNAYNADALSDVVHTKRRARYGESPLKMLITKIGYAILNRYSSVPIPPEAGDFKLLSRRVVDHVLKINEHRPFMRGLIAYVGFKQIFVCYERQARFAGKSKFFVLGKKVIANFFNSALINYSSVPLQIASYCGLGAILIDILLIVHVLYEKFVGHAVAGWAAMMIVTLFIGGVQLFCIGMIGLYLNSVHEANKQRPLYIINNTYGIKNTAS